MAFDAPSDGKETPLDRVGDTKVRTQLSKLGLLAGMDGGFKGAAEVFNGGLKDLYKHWAKGVHEDLRSTRLGPNTILAETENLAGRWKAIAEGTGTKLDVSLGLEVSKRMNRIYTRANEPDMTRLYPERLETDVLDMVEYLDRTTRQFPRLQGNAMIQETYQLMYAYTSVLARLKPDWYRRHRQPPRAGQWAYNLPRDTPGMYGRRPEYLDKQGTTLIRMGALLVAVPLFLLCFGSAFLTKDDKQNKGNMKSAGFWGLIVLLAALGPRLTETRTDALAREMGELAKPGGDYEKLNGEFGFDKNPHGWSAVVKNVQEVNNAPEDVRKAIRSKEFIADPKLREKVAAHLSGGNATTKAALLAMMTSPPTGTDTYGPGWKFRRYVGILGTVKSPDGRAFVHAYVDMGSSSRAFSEFVNERRKNTTGA